MSSRKIVVTGASGFLGRHLIERLKNDKDFYVFALSSHPEELKEQIGGANINYQYRESFFQNEDIVGDSCVVNCAFPRNATGAGMADGLKYIQKVFETSVDYKAAAIINISSQSVYSQQREEAATEETEICLESPYAVGKYATELMLESICRGKNTRYTNIRMGSLIGPGFDQRIVNRFVKQAINNGTMSVQLSSQKFGFLDVSDAVDGLMLVIRSADQLRANSYNLGNEFGYTIQEIADAVIAEVNNQREIAVTYTKSEGINKQNSTICSGKFKDTFHWTQKYTLSESVRKIVECEVHNNAGN